MVKASTGTEEMFPNEAARLYPWQGGTRDYAPNRVRHDDWETSREGARAVSLRAGSQKARLFGAYQGALPAGLTDEEAARVSGVPERSCWWKRCNELRDLGLITPTGETRSGLAGVQRIVCRAVGS